MQQQLSPMHDSKSIRFDTECESTWWLATIKMIRKKLKIMVLACAKTFLHIKFVDIFQTKIAFA